MKNKIYALILINFLLFTSLIITGCESENGITGDENLSSSTEMLNLENILSFPSEDLSQEEKEGLLFMREEEKLAHDVYVVLYETWGQKVFINISKSEQNHTDAVKVLIERYELTDPVTDITIGVFQNEDLKKLYDELTTNGKTSLVEALKVGAAIEEIDILDLKEQINNKVDNQDIEYVYGNLLRGSENHLRAFVRNLSSQGISYTPLYLDVETYNSIIGN